MRLEWLRPKSELKEVLYEPRSVGPEIAYWIFSDLTIEKWKDMTVIAPGLYGKEFPKTYGHYHTPHVYETYKLVHGDGTFLLQKKHYENYVASGARTKKWIPEQVDEVYMVKFSAGDELIIPQDFGHSWSNVGATPLITFDDWTSGHTATDYEAIKKLKGMAFYITLGGNGIKFVPNPNYKKLPDPKVITAKEFQRLYPIS